MSEPLQPADGQCAFYLPKKKRFCRFRPNQGQKYCPEHACILGVALERKRIVCPLNPKHTCYEDNLDKHLKKCNSRKRRTEEYYEEGINAGSEEGDSIADTQTAVKATDTKRLKEMIEKVNKLCEEHIGGVEEDIRSHDCLSQEMDNPYFGLSALRHRRQQASLIGQLEAQGLLAPGHCYVEMGAGKGQLSHWVRRAVSAHDDAAFLLVDRSSIRYKVDGCHKEEEKVKFERIKMDIEHLCLGKVPMIVNSQRPLVAMGKHLCGAATDLTLRCLMETLSSGSSDALLTEPSPKRPRTEGPTSAVPADCLGATGSSCGDVGISLSSPANCSLRSQCVSTDCPSGSTSHTESGELGKCERRLVSVEKREESGGETEGETKRMMGRGDGLKESVGDDHGAECPNRDLDTDLGKDSNRNRRVAGVLIALCCHHQCTWRAYVGKQFMRQCGISAADFHLLTRLSSWAVCGWRDRDGSLGTKEESPANIPGEDSTADKPTTDLSSESTPSHKVDSDAVGEEREHNTADLVSDTGQENGLLLTEKQKETVGWRCKRLIDHGRVCYLRQQGLCANLKIYIDTQQTPENVVMVATPALDQ